MFASLPSQLVTASQHCTPVHRQEEDPQECHHVTERRGEGQLSSALPRALGRGWAARERVVSGAAAVAHGRDTRAWITDTLVSCARHTPRTSRTGHGRGAKTCHRWPLLRMAAGCSLPRLPLRLAGPRSGAPTCASCGGQTQVILAGIRQQGIGQAGRAETTEGSMSHAPPMDMPSEIIRQWCVFGALCTLYLVPGAFISVILALRRSLLALTRFLSPSLMLSLALSRPMARLIVLYTRLRRTSRHLRSSTKSCNWTEECS